MCHTFTWFTILIILWPYLGSHSYIIYVTTSLVYYLLFVLYSVVLSLRCRARPWAEAEPNTSHLATSQRLNSVGPWESSHQYTQVSHTILRGEECNICKWDSQNYHSAGDLHKLGNSPRALSRGIRIVRPISGRAFISHTSHVRVCNWKNQNQAKNDSELNIEQ